jgi:hypothetical protein
MFSSRRLFGAKFVPSKKRGFDLNQETTFLRMALQLERVPCLPQ